jgi:hypothetical protein
MKNSIQRIAIIMSLLMMVACSNSDSGNNSSSLTGTVTFFNYVTGSSTLSLESIGRDRGLGTVDFEKFGPGIALKVQSWDLTVTDLREDSNGYEDVVLENVSFTPIKKRRTIHALIGDYDLETVELVNLTLAYDEQRGDDDGDEDGFRDDKAQYINFSHIHSDLGQLDIYLVEPSQSGTALSSLTPTAVVDFKESSAAIRLEESITKYFLRISLHGTNTEIYNSGERTLKDYLEQTIIIAPYTGAVSTGSQITSFYYGDGKSSKWLASNSQGQVRVFNAIQDTNGLDYILTSSGAPTINVDSNLLFKGLSPYEPVNTSAVTYLVTPEDAIEGTTFFDGLGPAINVEDGESWTVIFFGRVDALQTSSAIKVYEEDNVFSNKATFTFSNVAYVFDEDNRKSFNIHVKTPSEFLDASSVDIPLLEYGDYGSINLNAGNNYEIWVTDDKNLVVKAGPTTFAVDGGENFHFVLIENNLGGTPFQLVQLIGEASADRTLVSTDTETSTAGGVGVTITVQAKDRSANKLTQGGDAVILTVTGSGVLGGVTDNANGTYTATLTNAVAEEVTVTGTINGDDIVDTAIVTFTAP